jgi:hypothetical protein
MLRKLFLMTILTLSLLAFAQTASGADPMEGRLAAQSWCGAGQDWSAACGWVNIAAFTPVIYREHSYGSWGPLTIHDPDTGAVVQNMTDIAIPDYAAQGVWRTTEDPNRSDLAAVFIDYTHPQARICEAWVFDWRWWTGPTAYHGGCMNYTPGESTRAFPWPMGSQASGLRYIDGVVTVKEWRAWIEYGKVPNHELQAAVPLACKTFRAPANRSDGNAWATPENSNCIEYGTLYRLTPNYPQPPDCHVRVVAGCVWASFTRMAIAMAREHGIRISDQVGTSSNVVFRMENPGRPNPDWDGDPYPEFDWNTSEGRDNQLVRQFPMTALKVVTRDG